MQLKEKISRYNEFKKQQMFLSKRDRLMKTGWRHGVTGIDDADSYKTQCFYEDSKNQKALIQSSKDEINSRRLKSKICLNF